MQWRQWTRDEVRQAVEMRKAGLSAGFISEQLGKPESTIRDKMRRLGIKLTPEQRAAVNTRCGMGNSGGIRNNQFARGPELGGVQTAYELKIISEKFELAYCEAADRNGWPINGYGAAA
jgi:hypothetical protein